MNDQTQTPAEMAAAAVRTASTFVTVHPELRKLLPPDASPALASAIGAGIGARMVADLLIITLPKEHPLVGATMEYLSLSMGMLCHYTGSDASFVSATADTAMGILNTPPEGVDSVGEASIIQAP